METKWLQGHQLLANKKDSHLAVFSFIITRTGIEPVTPPWEGDVLNQFDQRAISLINHYIFILLFIFKTVNADRRWHKGIFSIKIKYVISYWVFAKLVRQRTLNP